MNYLSHFYISSKPDNYYYNLGLILPDISRGYVKTFKHEPILNDEELYWLQQGCLQHYTDDKTFHASEFFKQGSEICTQLVNNAGFSSEINRKWFLGHVLFELYVDRALVMHINKLATTFYNNLQQIDYTKLHRFLTLHQCTDAERVTTAVKNFTQAAYIKNYTDNNLFVYSLTRIMMRAKAGAFNASDKLILLDCVNQLENLILKDKLSLLYLLNNTFK